MRLWSKPAPKVSGEQEADGKHMTKTKQTKLGEIALSINKWSGLSERLKGIASSPEFDRGAVDESLAHFGIENASLYDPIALIKALSKQGVFVSVSTSNNGKEMFATVVTLPGGGWSTSGDDIVVQVSICVAEIVLNKLIRELNTLTVPPLGVEASSKSLYQHQQMMLQQYAQHSAHKMSHQQQQQLLQQHYDKTVQLVSRLTDQSRNGGSII